ncbi:hypothetical protein K505DRAFT_412529 [Melanomma pulvis-pyrius CBS 109.77]|uniref:C3H1-type domain-containing protein n=1 Tax=Melanomma pulvis-pyrius CBS 109.77 TaxID=1314802 RepID=A0A6A6XWY3_9PLEO|nr:hypothetical protein K505DRAFT_412529 [Melanomma pulvis-pyrius CBS 109.77]
MGLPDANTLAHHHPQHSLLDQGLRYYIVRPGNIMIPLIPADQLPFQLQGVPRQLNHQQMCEGGWKFLMETNESALHLPIQPPAQVVSLSPKFLPPDYKARGEATVTSDAVARVGKPPHSPRSSPTVAKPAQENHSYPRRVPTIMVDRSVAQESPDSRRSTAPIQDHVGSLTDSFANIYQKDAQRLNYRTPPPSGVEPDPSKKEFCTHWIKYGECAFTATGCRYKHEMPPMEKLRGLGFTSLPRWWKDKSAIRGLTWMERRLNEEDSDQVAEAPSHREFPDPSTFRRQKRDHSDHGSGMLKSTELKHERGVLIKDNERKLVKSLASHGKGQVPNLIDIDVDIDPPAPPPSLDLSTSTTSESSSELGSSSSLSSTSPPPSPRLDLVDLQKVTQDSSRYVRRHSEISWSSSDGKIHKQYPTRKSIPQKLAKPTPLPTASKKLGLGKSKYASKGTELATPTRKAVKGRKTESYTPAVKPRINKAIHHVGDKEGRRKITANPVQGTLPGTPAKQVPVILQ